MPQNYGTMSAVRRAVYATGMMIRETGQALDRAGSALQGSYAYKEQLSRHRQIMNLKDSKPIIGEDVFIAPSATVIGNVTLGPSASVWYGSVVRADSGAIRIGDGAAVFERALLSTDDGPVGVSAHARVSAGAVVSGADVAEEAAVGASSVVRRASVARHASLAPGSVLLDAKMGVGELWAGAPAVFVRNLTKEEIAKMVTEAQETVVLARAHADETGKTHDQIEAEKLREELLRDRSDDYHSHLGIVGQEREFIETQAQIVEAERKKQAAAGGM